MSYLNLDLDFFDHPKARRLVGMLGRGAEVLPIKLWCYCGKYHAKSGKLTGYATHEIESLCGWWGKEGEMLEAFFKLDLITKDKDGNLIVHDWSEHQGHLQIFKERAVKAAKTRWEKYKCSSNATSIAKTSLKQCPLPNLTIPTIIREANIIPPSLEMVTKFIKDNGYTIDPEQFMNSNQSKGWMIGKSRMKDWQAAVRTWVKNQPIFKTENNQTPKIILPKRSIG